VENLTETTQYIWTKFKQLNLRAEIQVMKAKTIFDFQLSLTESCLELQIRLFYSPNYLLQTAIDFTKYRTAVESILLISGQENPNRIPLKYMKGNLPTLSPESLNCVGVVVSDE